MMNYTSPLCSHPFTIILLPVLILCSQQQSSISREEERSRSSGRTADAYKEKRNMVDKPAAVLYINYSSDCHSLKVICSEIGKSLTRFGLVR